MKYLRWFKEDPKTCWNIVRIIGPSALQGFIISLASISDIFVISNFLKSNDALNGAAITIALLIFAAAIIFGTNQAGNIFIGRLRGDNRTQDIKKIVFYQMIFGFFGYLSLLALFFAIGERRILQVILGAEGPKNGNINDILNQGVIFFRVVTWSVLPFAFSNVIYSVSRVYGHVWFSVLCSFITVFTNIVLSILLVGGMTHKINLGITGVGAATIISRFLELCILIGYLIWTKPEWIPNWQSCRINFKMLKKFMLSISVAWINIAVYPLFLIIQQGIVARVGDNELLAGVNSCNTAAELFFTTLLGFSAVSPLFIGKYIGAGKIQMSKDNAEKVLLVSWVLILSMMIIFFTAAFWWGHLFKSLDEPQSQMYVRWFMMGLALGSTFYALGLQYFIIMKSRGYIILASLTEELLADTCYLIVMYLLLNVSGLSYQYSLFITPFSYIVVFVIGFALFKFLKWHRPLVKEQHHYQTKKPISIKLQSNDTKSKP